jgi:flavin prenyltransferase
MDYARTDSSARIVVAVTGASGAAYARRLVQCLIGGGAEVHLVVSPHGRQLLVNELGLPQVTGETLLGCVEERLILHEYHDLAAPLSSGSTPVQSMIICPCSSNTLGRIASGLGDNLIARAAQVTLKERRRLVLVPREMPVNHIDLENYVRLSQAGAIICPAAPGFYMHPARVEDLVDFVVGKLLDLVGVPHSLSTRWETMIAHPPAGAETRS